MKVTIKTGDALEQLRSMGDRSIQCCVTSPPYWGLRDYGHPSQLGAEDTPEEFTANLVEVFREVGRVLKDDGTLWLNLGDSYSRGDRKGVPPQRGAAASSREEEKYCFESASAMMGSHPVIKPKDLIGIPWRVALALQEDGWYLRQDIIWHKPAPMPESVTDRCTKAHEYLFLMSKSARYKYNAEPIQEIDEQGQGRNRRSVWSVNTQSIPEAHFATFPNKLAELCILAGSDPGDEILDPFGGSGTTGAAALGLGRSATLIELNPEYVELMRGRCNVTPGLGI